MRLGAGRVSEGRDDIAQGQQATVDRYPFFDTITYSGSSLELPRSQYKKAYDKSGRTYTFRASEINEMKFRDHGHPFAVVIVKTSSRIVMSKRTGRPKHTCACHSRWYTWCHRAAKCG